MKLVFVALCVAFAVAVPTNKLNTSPRAFEAWKAEHGKVYETQEEHDKRYNIFLENAAIIEKHNSEGHSWTMGLTQFADLTPKEFEAMQTLYPSKIGTDESPADFRHNTNGRSLKDLPSDIDWRKANLVNPIKNQAQCGSCWAFSTIVSYEGQVANKTGKLTSFSEQNLVDCVKDQEIPGSSQTCCMGCNGGLMDYAFAYMKAKQDGKADTESSYPYKASDGTCSFKASESGDTPVKSYTDIAKGDENSLKDAVATVGPISIAVDANTFWQLYRGGVFKPLFCGSRLDHGVAIVGYGSENGDDYWIVRNSWGESWGENGYMRIVMGKNECGLADSACYPNV